MEFDLILYFIVFTSAIFERQDTKQITTGALVNIGNNYPSVGKMGWENINRGQRQYFPNFGSVISNIDFGTSHYLYNISRNHREVPR